MPATTYPGTDASVPVPSATTFRSIEFNCAATAGETPLLAHAFNRIAEEIGDDSPAVIRKAITTSQVKAGVSLRPATVEAFCTEGALGIKSDIATTSDATKVRSGLLWLHFLLVALIAARIQRLYLFIDQLEDLALNKKEEPFAYPG